MQHCKADVKYARQDFRYKCRLNLVRQVNQLKLIIVLFIRKIIKLASLVMMAMFQAVTDLNV